MKYPVEFDDIRRLYDEEVHDAFSYIEQQPQVKSVVESVLGKDYAEFFLRNLGPINTVDEFQKEVIGVIITTIEHKTCKDVTLTGEENVDAVKGNLFVSNHRDIVLDSAFLNSHLLYKGFKTSQIGIGNNLLAAPWIEKAVRVNKAFVVKRDGSLKELLLISKHLSEYIRATRMGAESVWIAQREGRAKDSDDRTQTSIIKMFGMSGDGNIAADVEALNITPVSINYEFDPCDWLKAREFQLKRDNSDYKKTPQEDLLNMKTGMMGYKGRVSFVIGKPLRGLAERTAGESKNDAARTIAEMLDRAIHSGYQLFPNNYVAADMLEGGGRFAGKYDNAEAEAFKRYLQSRIDLIDIPGKDVEFLRRKLLEMYANPAINQAAAL